MLAGETQLDPLRETGQQGRALAGNPRMDDELELVNQPAIGQRQRQGDAADENIYLAESTNHEVVIINARTHALERVRNVGLFPWGTHIMDSKDNYCH